MHATDILRRCLGSVLDGMHAARRNRLMGAVEALVNGRRLTLIDLARSWVGALRSHAPLKALDRLLSNHHLHAEIIPLQRAMAAWLIGQGRPLILVDWSDLKGDGRWCLLRAAVPVRGRALTIYEKIVPLERMNKPSEQAAFLHELAQVVPKGVKPIVVTDAGFRSDWFRAVAALGWDFLGRVRNNTMVCANKGDWIGCKQLFPKATRKAIDLGEWQMVKGKPLLVRLVIAARQRRGRDQLTRKGKPQQGSTAKRARKSAREPWLLATSLSAEECSASRAIVLYSARWQIETAFRDLKSHQYGVGLEDSQSRNPKRLAVLLLLHALAAFAAWVANLAARTAEVTNHHPLTRQQKHRGRYSWYRCGMAWLQRGAIALPCSRHRLRTAMNAEIREIQVRSSGSAFRRVRLGAPGDATPRWAKAHPMYGLAAESIGLRVKRVVSRGQRARTIAAGAPRMHFYAGARASDRRRKTTSNRKMVGAARFELATPTTPL